MIISLKDLLDVPEVEVSRQDKIDARVDKRNIRQTKKLKLREGDIYKWTFKNAGVVNIYRGPQLGIITRDGYSGLVLSTSSGCLFDEQKIKENLVLEYKGNKNRLVEIKKVCDARLYSPEDVVDLREYGHSHICQLFIRKGAKQSRRKVIGDISKKEEKLINEIKRLQKLLRAQRKLKNKISLGAPLELVNKK